MREVQSVESPEWVSTVTAGSLTDPFSLLGASIVLMVACGFLLFGRPVETVLVLLLMPLRFPAHFSKAIVERERPSGEVGLAGTGGDLSFASGHAEWLVTFYGFLVILALLRIKNSWLRAGIVTAFAVFAILSTFSRVNGGYHWPLDIVGGWIIGAGLLCLLFWLRRAALATTRAPRTQDSSADRSATNVS
jgi:membrane-associated phospholipid phosphatase